jgi:hypothetical protein
MQKSINLQLLIFLLLFTTNSQILLSMNRRQNSNIPQAIGYRVPIVTAHPVLNTVGADPVFNYNKPSYITIDHDHVIFKNKETICCKIKHEHIMCGCVGAYVTGMGPFINFITRVDPNALSEFCCGAGMSCATGITICCIPVIIKKCCGINPNEER